MKKQITAHIAVAYSQCPRKAFLLLSGAKDGKVHEYVEILTKTQHQGQTTYLETLREKGTIHHPFSTHGLESKAERITNAVLETETFHAECGLLTKTTTHSKFGHYSYQPTIFVGTHTVSKEQRLALFFTAHVLEEVQQKAPTVGYIVNAEGKARKVKLDDTKSALLPVMEPLKEWLTEEKTEEPPVILHKHCQLCQFRDACRAKAEQEDSLSLLDRVTPKIIRKYEKKGIFTVKQLSYTYKPRRRKKRTKNPPPVTHKLELQALAIREQKIYIAEMPEIERKPVELFLDIEGIPDQNVYYLIGLLVCEGESSTHHSFWADELTDEPTIWQQFVEKANEYPDAPIYHYGNYEVRALKKLANRNETDADAIIKRLVNVNGFIYGKVYFPTYSNRLKELGKFIGAEWSSEEASGLQSLVWRYHWEQSQNLSIQQKLIVYNRDDCKTLKYLTHKLHILNTDSHTESVAGITDESHNPYKFARDQLILEEFKQINKCAYFDYQRTRIFVRTEESVKRAQNRVSKMSKVANQPNKVIEATPPSTCTECGSSDFRLHQNHGRKLHIDLTFSRGTVKKWVTLYVKKRFRCHVCKSVVIPDKYKYGRKYGHSLRLWIVNHHVGYRIAAEKLTNILLESFSVELGYHDVYRFVSEFASMYECTYKNIKQHLLNGRLIHADETSVSIKGTSMYVWTLTNIDSVVYIFRPTREVEFLHLLLHEFEGILVTDFYSGYDAAPCTQQKCLIHLIRDMNDDLFHNPFDEEYQKIATGFGKLLRYIVGTIDNYGLKQRHLNKHKHDVERFYRQFIYPKCSSELSLKYQAKFTKYRGKLFAFLDHDGIPWNNNNAEHAIKAFATYRRVADGLYTENSLSEYLVLFSIQQTCKYRGLSFFEFLKSGEMSLEKYTSQN